MTSTGGEVRLPTRAVICADPSAVMLVTRPSASTATSAGRDEVQVTGPATAAPTAVDPATVLEPGARSKVTLTGVPALRAGQLVIAREGKAVGGRVVSIEDGAAGRVVVLEWVPLVSLFRRMKIAAQHTVDEAALVAEETMPTIKASAPRPPVPGRRVEPVEPILRAVKIGPFECEASGGGNVFTLDAKVRIVPNLRFDYNFDKDANDDWSAVRVQLTGSVSATGSVTASALPGFMGSYSCRGTLAKLPLHIGGPLAAIVSFQIPLGIKGDVAAKVMSTPMIAGLEVTGTGRLDLGFT